VMVVVGTRPEAIKMAPVLDALRKSGRVDTQLVFTGQHGTLVNDLRDALDLVPDHDLAIMSEGQSLYDVAEGCLRGLAGVVQDYGPDMILVQGDTATVFFASLVAFFERVPVGHVESGLRTGDKWSPFPEEIFRRLTDVITDVHFAPTTQAKENLRREGVDVSQIHVTGNTVVDSLLRMSARGGEPANETLGRILEDGSRRLILLTAHRRESFGEPLLRIFRAVRRLIDEHEDVQLLYPVHPNPNVVEPAQMVLGDHPRIHLVESLAYQDMVMVLRKAVLILTDSGGIQEEAPTFGVPVLVLREVTERTEALEAGAVMVGSNEDDIVTEGSRLLGRTETIERKIASPFGDGRAGERIADIIVSQLTGSSRSMTDWSGP
jgi:UDP-N-acetylglucosamine 2-epimerase (non-hydrolysing)